MFFGRFWRRWKIPCHPVLPWLELGPWPCPDLHRSPQNFVDASPRWRRQTSRAPCLPPRTWRRLHDVWNMWNMWNKEAMKRVMKNIKISRWTWDISDLRAEWCLLQARSGNGTGLKNRHQLMKMAVKPKYPRSLISDDRCFTEAPPKLHRRDRFRRKNKWHISPWDVWDALNPDLLQPRCRFFRNWYIGKAEKFHCLPYW